MKLSSYLFRNFLWTLFTAILVVIAYKALWACTLKLPGVGVVIQRCPEVVVPAIAMPSSETEQLIREYQSLRSAVARAPNCPDKSKELPADVPAPPQIRRGSHLAIIIDTTTSMETYDQSVKDILRRLMVYDPPKGLDISLWRFNTTNNDFSACKKDPLLITTTASDSVAESIAHIDFSGAPDTLIPALMAIPTMFPDGIGRSSDKPATVILINDGNNQCSGDNAPAEVSTHPTRASLTEECVVAGILRSRMPHMQLHIIAFNEKVETTLKCLTTQTDGWMIQSTDNKAIRSVINHIAGTR